MAKEGPGGDPNLQGQQTNGSATAESGTLILAYLKYLNNPGEIYDLLGRTDTAL